MPTNVPRLKITLLDPFWTEWQRAFLDRGLRHQFEQCESTGRFENFRKVTRGESSGHEGYYFNDSDVYKWLEAASYALSSHPDWDGASLVDEAIAIVGAAQDPDGYLGTPFQIGQRDKRWKALTARHEMYCIGHLIEAGVAHFVATGKSSLLDIARRAADLVVETFGPNLKKGYCGHEEIELAFCRLSELTGEERYRNLAQWMVESRGTRPSPFLAEFDDPDGKELNKNYVPLVFPNGEYDGSYFQDDVPLADQTKAVGHAVRAMYLFCGAVDACDNPKLSKALTTIWDNLVQKRMYITGGIGSAGRNAGFTSDYDLPNREAYAETCAAIGLVFWASRMSRVSGDSKYADVMELALYNAALSGVNFDTDRYFYVNPLESRGDHVRQPWFGCACCPPNIARLVMSVQQYAGYVTADGLTIDLPLGAEYTFEAGGSECVVHVESGYPWSGSVAVTVKRGGQFQLRLRIPEWQRDLQVRLDGEHYESFSNGYLVVDRAWKAGDRLVLDFGMSPEWMVCDPRVADNVGRVALKNGPLIYCLEEADFGRPVHLFRPDTTKEFEHQNLSDLRMKSAITVKGVVERVKDQPKLYGALSTAQFEEGSARFVPYFSWANRTPGSMAVWFLCDH